MSAMAGHVKLQKDQQDKTGGPTSSTTKTALMNWTGSLDQSAVLKSLGYGE